MIWGRIKKKWLFQISQTELIRLVPLTLKYDAGQRTASFE